MPRRGLIHSLDTIQRLARVACALTIGNDSLPAGAFLGAKPALECRNPLRRRDVEPWTERLIGERSQIEQELLGQDGHRGSEVEAAIKPPIDELFTIAPPTLREVLERLAEGCGLVSS